MKSPLVSIIIPTYNSADLLPETVESALQQTYSNIEIIVVDDGSTDDTETLFNDFQNKGVQCYTIKNQGASNARNVGVSKSKGIYIQFLDADDILHSNKIELQVQKMLLEDADISFTQWAHFSTDVSKHSEFKFKNINYSNTCTGKELLISFGMENWFMPVFTWLIHKELIQKAGEWNVEITNNDDGEYFSRVLYDAQKVICVNQILSYYRVLPSNSLSKVNSIKKVESAMKSYHLITELLKKDENTALLSYAKRMYYMIFRWTRYDFPEISKKAAKEFDKLHADCFLRRRKKYWFFINLFGLYNGTILYKNLVSIWMKIKK